MRAVLFGLLLLTLSVAFACKGGPTREIPSAPAAATPAPTQPVKSVAKIVAFGDSLTIGYGLSPEESYPALLQKKLAADGFNYEVVQAGISGDTTAGGLRRIDWSLDQGDVKIVILELGGNDILRGQPITEMKKNLAAIIERVKARGAQVLLAGMEAPTNSGIDYRRWTHGAYSELAKEQNVPMIPFFLDHVAGIQSLNQADGIHPNAQGARIVADTVYQYLKPMLEKP